MRYAKRGWRQGCPSWDAWPLDVLTFLRSNRLMDRNMRLPARNAAKLGSSTSCQVACTAARAAAEGGSTAGCSTSGTMPRLRSWANVPRKMPAEQQPPGTVVLFPPGYRACSMLEFLLQDFKAGYLHAEPSGLQQAVMWSPTAIVVHRHLGQVLALPWVKELLTRIWCAWPVEISSMLSITTRYAACSRDCRLARSLSGKWQ